MLSHCESPMPYLVCICQRAKTSCQTQIHGTKNNFDIEVKGQGHTELMNVRDISYHGYTCTLRCQTKYDYLEWQKS